MFLHDLSEDERRGNSFYAIWEEEYEMVFLA
jgi:hypothetical protein